MYSPRVIRFLAFNLAFAVLAGPALAQAPPDSAAAAAAAQAAKDSLTVKSAPAAGVAVPAGTTPAPASTPPPATPAPAAASTPPAQTPAPAAAPPPAQTQAPAKAQPAKKNSSPFARGNIRLTLTGGYGQSFNDDYFILGGGLGYYIKNGVDVGLSFEKWFSGDPGVTKLSPEITVIKSLPRGISPYLGAYYQRTFIDGYSDLNSLGGRVGAYKNTRGPAMFGVGAVYEKYLDCQESTYNDCDDWYPELLFGTTF